MSAVQLPRSIRLIPRRSGTPQQTLSSQCTSVPRIWASCFGEPWTTRFPTREPKCTYRHRTKEMTRENPNGNMPEHGTPRDQTRVCSPILEANWEQLSITSRHRIGGSGMTNSSSRAPSQKVSTRFESGFGSHRFGVPSSRDTPSPNWPGAKYGIRRIAMSCPPTRFITRPGPQNVKRLCSVD